jgi:hypothetical protein
VGSETFITQGSDSQQRANIHLNPKIGPDWMVRGQQKQVVAPGKNEKRYRAGAQDTRIGEVVWVEGERKTSLLFICLFWNLVQRYPDARRRAWRPSPAPGR